MWIQLPHVGCHLTLPKEAPVILAKNIYTDVNLPRIQVSLPNSYDFSTSCIISITIFVWKWCLNSGPTDVNSMEFFGSNRRCFSWGTKEAPNMRWLYSQANFKGLSSENRPEVRKQWICAMDLDFTGFHVEIYIWIIFLCIISTFEGTRVTHSSIHSVV